jgi:hypothetical protein
MTVNLSVTISAVKSVRAAHGFGSITLTVRSPSSVASRFEIKKMNSSITLSGQIFRSLVFPLPFMKCH